MKDGKIYGCPRPTPTTAAEWAIECGRQMHPGGFGNTMCLLCADAYARQQVEAALRPFCDCGESAAGGTHHAKGCIYNRVIKAGSFK